MYDVRDVQLLKVPIKNRHILFLEGVGGGGGGVNPLSAIKIIFFYNENKMQICIKCKNMYIWRILFYF